MDDTGQPTPDQNEPATDPTGQPIFADPILAPQVDAFGLPPVAPAPTENETAAMQAQPGFIERAEETIERFIAPRHPDDAIARIAEILDNMHGSDDQRRKVVQAIVGRFGG